MSRPGIAAALVAKGGNKRQPSRLIFCGYVYTTTKTTKCVNTALVPGQ